MGWVINATPRPLYPWERDPVPMVQEAGWAPGPVWTGSESFTHTGIQSPDCSARNELLYRLSYPGQALKLTHQTSERLLLALCPNNLPVS